MKKRLWATFLVLCMVLGMLPGTAWAGSDDIEYPVKGGRIHINRSTWMVEGCEQSVTEADIPREIDGHPIVGIAQSGFYHCINLTRVTIPEGVTTIGDGAFDGCSNLVSVSIPDSVTSIGNYAFRECTNLTDISIPEGAKLGFGIFTNAINVLKSDITQIYDNAFMQSDKLTNATIPDGVERIGQNAFSFCTNLTSVTLPESLKSIDGGAFLGCSGLASVTIPANVTEIGDSAFAKCSNLTSVTLSASKINFVGYTFGESRMLSEIVFKNGVTSITGDSYALNLKKIVIPASVVHIDQNVFAWPSLDDVRLTNVYYGGSKQQWDALDKGRLLEYATVHYNSAEAEEPSVEKPGDLTGDGIITMADVVRLARGATGSVALTEQEQKMGDVNGDGKITMADVVRLARYAGGSISEL